MEYYAYYVCFPNCIQINHCQAIKLKIYEVTVDKQYFVFLEIFAVFVYMYLELESNHKLGRVKQIW